MKQKEKKIVVIFMILGFFLVGLFFIHSKTKPKNMVEIAGLYDVNGNPLNDRFSVINGVEGVRYITLEINIENLDKVPLDFVVKSITPLDVSNSKPTTTLSLDSKSKGKWITGLIDITPYEGTVQDFCVNVESLKIPFLRESSNLTGCISVKVDKNPVGVFNLSVDSEVGDGGANPGCTESWKCTEWGGCSNGFETRVCTDSNNCGTTSSKPSEKQNCEISFLTNAVNGDYKHSSVWIDFGGGKYNYGGESTYNCLSENIILNTPEGYPVCTRPGYEITKRVYLDIGTKGLIFKP